MRRTYRGTFLVRNSFLLGQRARGNSSGCGWYTDGLVVAAWEHATQSLRPFSRQARIGHAKVPSTWRRSTAGAAPAGPCRRCRSNPSGNSSQERPTWGTASSTMRRACAALAQSAQTACEIGNLLPNNHRWFGKKLPISAGPPKRSAPAVHFRSSLARASSPSSPH